MAQFTNQATISYNGVTAASNIVTGEVTQVLTAWKKSTYGVYQPGDILTYVVSIQNSGINNLTDIEVTSDLGAYTFGTDKLVPLTYTGDPILYYINGVLQASPTAQAGPPLVIREISVPAGMSSVLVYRARVNEYAPLGTGAKIENTASISGGGLTTDVIATETVNASQAAALTIIKALNPTTVVEKGQVAYTFTIQNTGATAASAGANLIISDTFTPTLDIPISVALNGTLWPQVGNYSYDPSSGIFSTIAGRVTVPAATYTQNAVSGLWSITPGVTTLTVTGTI